jgi:hypothetical protein
MGSHGGEAKAKWFSSQIYLRIYIMELSEGLLNEEV